MVKMTKNSDVGGLLEPIDNSAIWKSVLCEAVLHKAKVYLCKYFSYPILTHNSGKHDDWHNSKNNIGQNIDVRGALRHFTFNALSRMSFNHLLRFIYYLNLYHYSKKHICPYISQSTGLIIVDRAM